MKKSKADRILKKIAAQNGVTVSEVRREIELALKAGMDNPDPAVREKWNSISTDGQLPSPEEALSYLEDQLPETVSSFV